MGKTYDHLNEKLQAFIAKQHMFFVASAPLSGDGRVNVSPKGLDTFRILDDKRVAYLDFVGSGAETIAHVRENGRLTVMFTSFSGPPNIVRLQGRGRAVLPSDDDFTDVSAAFDMGAPGIRAIIVLDIDRIADSCGYGVPRYDYVGERDQLEKWARKKGPGGLAKYQREKNAVSIDGLPALDGATPRDKADA